MVKDLCIDYEVGNIFVVFDGDIDGFFEVGIWWKCMVECEDV